MDCPTSLVRPSRASAAVRCCCAFTCWVGRKIKDPLFLVRLTQRRRDMAIGYGTLVLFGWLACFSGLLRP